VTVDKKRPRRTPERTASSIAEETESMEEAFEKEAAEYIRRLNVEFRGRISFTLDFQPS
jgi:hypothetical protein